MPIAKFEMPDGKIARFEVPEGTTPEQAQTMIQDHISNTSFNKEDSKLLKYKEKPAAQPQRGIGEELARQVGLTGRSVIQGLGGVADFVATPIREGMNLLLPDAYKAKTGSFGLIADAVSLPKPETKTERVVGQGVELMSGGGGLAGLASKAAQTAKAGSLAQQTFQALAANPTSQMSSGAGAGMAGQYAKEEGAGVGGQLTASILGGITAPYATGKAFNMLAPRQQAKNAETIITQALSDQYPQNVKNLVRQDVEKALQISPNLSEDAIRRLADYRALGLTPTQATVTLDPAIVTQQKNLAKLGANLRDKSAQQLSRTEYENMRGLIDKLNDLGASQGQDSYLAGKDIIASLEAKNAAKEENISKLYKLAKDTQGRSARLDQYEFTQKAGDLLSQNNLESFLPKGIAKQLNDFATGKTPLTIKIAEQFKTNIGRIQRNSKDGNEKYALGLVRQALDDTPLIDTIAPAKVNGGFQLKTLGGLSDELRPNLGQEAIDAFNAARAANRKWMGIVEKTPALQAIRDGVEADKFVNDYIIGQGNKSNFMDVAMLKSAIKSDTQALNTIRTQILSHLKKSALGGADDVSNFSPKAFNNALDKIGDRKLKLFFDPETIQELKTVGRVASYETFQPRGSAVNNANTAGATLGAIINKFLPAINKVTFDIPENIITGARSKAALSAPKSLVLQQPKQKIGLGVSPLIFSQFLTNE